MITPPQDATEPHSRPSLIITRGLPASGKTTWALHQLAERPHGTLVRVNRDELRRMLHGKPRYTRESEGEVTVVQHQAIGTMLALGKSVIVDDTNLDPVHVDALRQLASFWSVTFAEKDFTYVPLDTCIRRDKNRGAPDHVGEAVIRDMHARHLAPGRELVDEGQAQSGGGTR